MTDRLDPQFSFLIDRMRELDLDAHVRHVAMLVCSYADGRSPIVKVDLDEISAQTGLAVSGIRRAIDVLIGSGLVTRVDPDDRATVGLTVVGSTEAGGTEGSGEHGPEA